MYNEDMVLDRKASSNLIKSLANPDREAIQRRDAYLKRINASQLVKKTPGKTLLRIPELDLSCITDKSMRILDTISVKKQIEIHNNLCFHFYCGNESINMQGEYEEQSIINSVNSCKDEGSKDHAIAAA